MTKRRGYTLTELLTTVAIIVILATVTVVGFVTYINKSQNGKADTEFAQINKAFEASYISGGLFYIGSDENYTVYLEKSNDIAYIVLLPTNNGEYDTQTESITLTKYAPDFQNLLGTLTCTLAKGFYDEFELNNSKYYRTLCDVKYTTEEGIERDITLNEKSKEELKVILEGKMIEAFIKEKLASGSIKIGEYNGNGDYKSSFDITIKSKKDPVTREKIFVGIFSGDPPTVLNMVLSKKCEGLENRFGEKMAIVFDSYKDINTINPYAIISHLRYGDAYIYNIYLQ